MGTAARVPIVLVGNKSDLDHERCVLAVVWLLVRCVAGVRIGSLKPVPHAGKSRSARGARLRRSGAAPSSSLRRSTTTTSEKRFIACWWQSIGSRTATWRTLAAVAQVRLQACALSSCRTAAHHVRLCASWISLLLVRLRHPRGHTQQSSVCDAVAEGHRLHDPGAFPRGAAHNTTAHVPPTAPTHPPAHHAARALVSRLSVPERMRLCQQHERGGRIKHLAAALTGKALIPRYATHSISTGGGHDRS